MVSPIRTQTRVTVAVAGLGAAMALAGALAGTAPGAEHVDGKHERGPLDIHRTSNSQHRSKLEFAIATADGWAAPKLRAFPAFDPSRPQDYLCLETAQRTDHRRWCLTRRPSGAVLLGGHVNDAGELVEHRRLRARIKRPRQNTARLIFGYGAAGLHPGDFRWRFLTGWGDPSCAPEPPAPSPESEGKTKGRPQSPPPAAGRSRRPCVDRAPDTSFYHAHVIRPRRVGCSRDEDMFNSAGSRSRKRVALTFDDGPGSYTPRVIDILEHNHTHGTFFVVGQEIPGRTSLLRRMIEGGHEIGNHSMHHETSGASSSSLRETSNRIEAASGFEPCTYRPPGGYVSASTSEAAWSQGMSNILWDVDPQDWSRPGSSAIYSRVVGNTRSGSIVLMHDGGGDRSQTVAALDNIIDTLKGRGYRLVTVSKLLGERYRWVP